MMYLLTMGWFLAHTSLAMILGRGLKQPSSSAQRHWVLSRGPFRRTQSAGGRLKHLKCTTSLRLILMCWALLFMTVVVGIHRALPCYDCL